MKCLKVETFEIFLQPHSLLTFLGVITDLGDYFAIYNLVKVIRLNDITDSIVNYTNPGYGLSLVDTLWNAGSYRQPLEQEGNPMT